MPDAKQPRPTIYDVAQEAGVSKSLVSLVLNGSDLVSQSKREAVQEAIEKLGYRRSRAAASLARHRTHTVGLVVDDFENPWYVPLHKALRAELAQHGLHVAIREQSSPAEGQGNAIDDFLDSQVDALVVAAEPGRDFDALGIPTAIQGSRLHTISGADIVSSDEALGMELLVDHLTGLGHRFIGHVSGRGGSATRRREGYLAAMARRSLPVIMTGEDLDTTDEAGYLGTRTLLAAHPELTAVMAANDTMAAGALAALHEAGRDVPLHTALTGYDNSHAARSRLLDLTTIDPRNDEAGRQIARTLLRRLDDPTAPAQRIQVACELKVRTSTARGELS